VREISTYLGAQARELKEEFKPPTIPLQPLLDRFAATMVFHGRPPAMRWWTGFMVELPNWLTIHEDAIKLKNVDGIPEALFMTFAIAEEQYPLNKDVMRRDTDRLMAGAQRKLFETWEDMPLEQRSRLALAGIMYNRRGPGEANPAPKTEDELVSFLLDTDFTELDEEARADAALALYDAMRMLGPDHALRAKVELTLPGPGAQSSLKTRAIVAFIGRYLDLLNGDPDGASAQIPALEAILREASVDVIGDGPAFALALWGLTEPIYLDVVPGTKLDGEVLGALSWMADPRLLVRADPALKTGEYRLTMDDESLTAASGYELKLNLLKLQHEQDPLLVQNREYEIRAWTVIEQMKQMREEAGRE
jgi:hypothetical protein